METQSDLKKILVVDDEPKMCATLKKVLEASDYSVEIAYNGNDGWNRVQEFFPNCVLLDMRMPGGNGFDLLKQIKAKYPDTIILVTTAVIDESMMRMCIKAGANAYLIKPINFQKLLTQVEQYLSEQSGSDTAA